MNAEERRQLALAEQIVSSEPFMWLMAGSNHTAIQLDALRDAYAAWRDLSGGYARYNGLRKKLSDDT